MNADSLVRRIAKNPLVRSALVALCGYASSRSAFATPGGAKARPSSELRVMTFNLRVRTLLDGPNIWDRRRDSVVEQVRGFDPDLLGTQEGLAAMEGFLQQQLGDYTFFGAGRGDGALRGEMCGVFFKTTRFELLDAGHFWLSATPEQPGSRGWGALFPRMVTWVKLQPRGGGQPFCWFNTHFEAFKSRARVESAKLLRERMAQIAGTMPSVITGDFNASPDSVPYRTLLAEQPAPASSLSDVFRAANPTVTRKEGTVHFFTGWRGGRRMDWILASTHFHTIDAEIDRARGARGYPSDHFPVTATLRVPATTSALRKE
jgi:endonuclease/exonuclease/phosphatase family metal-dependent hydrolase